MKGKAIFVKKTSFTTYRDLEQRYCTILFSLPTEETERRKLLSYLKYLKRKTAATRGPCARKAGLLSDAQPHAGDGRLQSSGHQKDSTRPPAKPSCFLKFNTKFIPKPGYEK